MLLANVSSISENSSLPAESKMKSSWNQKGVSQEGPHAGGYKPAALPAAHVLGGAHTCYTHAQGLHLPPGLGRRARGEDWALASRPPASAEPGRRFPHRPALSVRRSPFLTSSAKKPGTS